MKKKLKWKLKEIKKTMKVVKYFLDNLDELTEYYILKIANKWVSKKARIKRSLISCGYFPLLDY